VGVVSHRRRALLLGGLALVLGGLAASNVASREAALSRRVGGLVDVVVAGKPIAAGAPIRRSALAVRQVPRRFAPAARIGSPRMLEGLKAAVAIAPDTDLTAAMVGDGRPAAAGPAIGKGERIAEVVALGSPDLITRGSRVDVLVTTEPEPSGSGRAILALEDVEVLDAGPVAAEQARGGGDAPGERVAASLIVKLREAVYLAAAQDFARELRLLPRAEGDRAHGQAGMQVGALPP
jgi:pilus assembly protein CpaB